MYGIHGYMLYDINLVLALHVGGVLKCWGGAAFTYIDAADSQCLREGGFLLVASCAVS